MTMRYFTGILAAPFSYWGAFGELCRERQARILSIDSIESLNPEDEEALKRKETVQFLLSVPASSRLAAQQIMMQMLTDAKELVGQQRKKPQYKYFTCTLTAPFFWWDDLRTIANEKQAQLLSIEGISVRSITEEDEESMATREDALFLFEVLESSLLDANAIVRQIYEEAEEAIEDDNYEEDEDV